MHRVSAPLSAELRGVWRRVLLHYPRVLPIVRDTTSHCIWLQTSCWCADLRIDRRMPDFDGVDSIEVCSKDQLLWMASQTSFVARVQVEGDVCTWQHVHDLVPLPFVDQARLSLPDPQHVEERGTHIRFLEKWRKEPIGEGRQAVLANGCRDDRPSEFLLFSGEYAMHVRARDCGLPRAAPHPLWPRGWKRWSVPELRGLLGYEASLARRSARGFIVELSLRPWLNGTLLFKDVAFDGIGGATLTGAGSLPASWRVVSAC